MASTTAWTTSGFSLMTSSVVKTSARDQCHAVTFRIEQHEIVARKAVVIDLEKLVEARDLHHLVLAVEPRDDVETLGDDLDVVRADACGIEHGKELVLVATEPEPDAVAGHVLDAFDAALLACHVGRRALLAELHDHDKRNTVGARGDDLVGMTQPEGVRTLGNGHGRLDVWSGRQQLELDSGLGIVALVHGHDRACELALDDPFETHGLIGLRRCGDSRYQRVPQARPSGQFSGSS